ncbi:MAG TPA: tocopherol cyclase family protein [Baekduia sp.]|uniref:tocopherol cyclase family protein n=1 Tax=Baekduia sp. TaxID=2600305 RepID=UPI002D770322|nr:tocopherol cyclase family protein [Baekduia sp.]HET6506731.1 tocopherol cyclase family protein [Baekduia sp.]
MISDTYRRTGADLPFGDPRRPHGVAMEGWFWRFTHPGSGDVAVVLAGVNRDGAGRAWGTVGLAAHPGGLAASALVADARATADGAVAIGAGDGDAEGADGVAWLRGDARSVSVRLGAASLDVALEAPARWPRGRAFGGLGAAQAIPGLSQYWHPWLLRARVRGGMVVGGREVPLDGAIAYAEKNWSNGGFPETWWWGQAHAFDADPDACVAFAGGRAGIGPLRLTATSLVVSAGGELHRLVRPLQPLRVDVGDGGWRLRGRTPAGVAVTVEGHANGTPPHLLPVPEPRARRHRQGAAAQHLAGELRVVLRRRGRTVFDGTSTLAGLERGAAPTP